MAAKAGGPHPPAPISFPYKFVSAQGRLNKNECHSQEGAPSAPGAAVATHKELGPIPNGVMEKKKKEGKKSRKHGRTGRRPSTARRKFRRPDIYRKAKRTLQSSGSGFLIEVWVPERIEFEKRVMRLAPEAASVLVRRARDAALKGREA